MTRWLLAIAALSLAVPARAEGPPARRWTVGARVGFAFGLGKLDGTTEMRDAVDQQIPVQLDVAFRVRPRLAVGAYGAYGFGRVSGTMQVSCGGGGACTSTALRLGGQVLYYFEGEERTPWIGLGAGWQSLSVDTGPVELEVTGWEYLVLQGGIDIHESARIHLGGFLSGSLGRFTRQTVGGFSTPLDARTHEWITLGVRGEFRL